MDRSILQNKKSKASNALLFVTPSGFKPETFPTYRDALSEISFSINFLLFQPFISFSLFCAVSLVEYISL